MRNAFLWSVALATLCLSGLTWADSSVTRTLNASPVVSAGAQVVVENLVGHMTVSQGASFRVTANVAASGSQAQALAQSVKLDVTTADDQVTVHVHYPVNVHEEYRYVTDDRNDKVCVLGVVCFNGEHASSFNYQGKQVHIHRGRDAGVPLHVDVALRIPAGVRVRLVNGVGLLEANGLANSLMAETHGGELRVTGLKGNLQASTDGGDAYLGQSTGDMRLETDGGDGRVSGVTGSLDANTGGGDLYVTSYTSGRKVTLNTGGGDLHLSANLAAARSLDVATGGGDSFLAISHPSMHLDVVSGGGDISVHLPGARNANSDDSHYSADLGNARGQGNILTGGGDVDIEKGAGE